MLISTLIIFPVANKHTVEDVISALVVGYKLHPIYAVETKEKRVAFSFDAAWGATRTPHLMQILDKHNIKTTFFLTNIWLKQYPQIAKDISEAGHEIGLHTANHPNLSQLSKSQILLELSENAQMVKEITSQEPVLFRPPFGAYNNLVIETVKEAKYIPIQWSVDSLDWKNLSADDIYKRITTRVKPGDIILFHNDGKNTPQALEPIIDFLKQEGYSIVPISELIYHNNYYVNHQGIQFPQE